jgi:hypothetical protein
MKEQMPSHSLVTNKSRERKPIFERKMNTNFFDVTPVKDVEIFEGHKLQEE